MAQASPRRPPRLRVEVGLWPIKRNARTPRAVAWRPRARNIAARRVTTPEGCWSWRATAGTPDAAKRWRRLRAALRPIDPQPVGACAGHEGQQTEADVAPAGREKNIAPPEKGNRAGDGVKPHTERPHDIGAVFPHVVQRQNLSQELDEDTRRQ